jgi:flagella basal body P-ring formation protein FlgA
MLRSPGTLVLLLLALLLPLAAAAPAAEPEPAARIEVRVLPQVEVPGMEFTLGEVAELDGADLALVRRLASLSLGRAPQPGRSLRLNESYLRARISQEVDPNGVELTVPPGAEVRRAVQEIPGADIAARVLAVAAEQGAPAGAELEQELAVPIPAALLPRGELVWEIEPMGQYLAAGGTRTYRVVARVGGEEVWRTVARVNQQVYAQVVVAARAVRRNQLIRAADVALERKAVGGVKPEDYLTRVAEVVGSRAKRPIGRGEWVRRNLLAEVADVPEGGPVLLVYATEAVRFSTPGVALVPAKVGAFIPVRNLASGKIVYGVVQADDTVKVN